VRLILLVALTLVVSFSLSPDAASAQAKRKQNILWISCEDMSPRLGCYGDATVPTPNIDRLASEGVRYTRAFGVYGVCAPNRHAIILGMYPSSNGAMAMRTWKRTAALDKITDPKLLAIPTYEATPPAEAKCFSEYLRAAGYYCTNHTKQDYQFIPPRTAWDDTSDKAHWRNRPTLETPFFAVINLTDTHESGTFAQRSPIVVDPKSVTLPPYYPDTPIVRRDLARHYDNIAAMDRKVGEILAQLEKDGLRDSTTVVFFSDHGDGLPRMKRWVYDSGIHVPLIVRYPDGSHAGTTNDELVSFVDFAPAVLSLTGLPIPDHMQGQAFLGAAKAPPRKYVHACRDRMDPAPETIRAVRDHRFKYVRNYRPELPYIGFIPYRDRAEIMQEIHRLTSEGALDEPRFWQLTSQSKPKEELYDTLTDPHEIRDLANAPGYQAKLVELRKAHEEWKTATNDLGHIPETELIRRLWPPEGAQPTTAEPIFGVTKNADAKLVHIDCATLGASVTYRVGKSPPWLLYSKPFSVPNGSVIEAQAFRLGWKPSEIVRMLEQ